MNLDDWHKQAKTATVLRPAGRAHGVITGLRSLNAVSSYVVSTSMRLRSRCFGNIGVSDLAGSYWTAAYQGTRGQRSQSCRIRDPEERLRSRQHKCATRNLRLLPFRLVCRMHAKCFIAEVSILARTTSMPLLAACSAIAASADAAAPRASAFHLQEATISNQTAI